MRYMSAYLLATIGGKLDVSKNDIENILGSVGIDCDSESADVVINKLKGKSIEAVIASGSSHLASISSSVATSAAVPAGNASAAAPAEVKKAAPKEEAKEEKEESDDDMGFGLFD